MLKKLVLSSLFILTLGSVALAAGCASGDNKNLAEKIKVVYELEGGKYQNSVTNVSHYYEFADGAKKVITPLENFTKDGKITEYGGNITKDGGFTLEGWYKVKREENGKTVYDEKWDFSNEIPAEGLTLYAKWEAPIIYSFDFVYFDDNGAEQLNKSFKVDAGDKFSKDWGNDWLGCASKNNKYENHTAVALYYDAEHTEPFDDSKAHPGGESSNAIKIYIDYIPGIYTVARTAKELKKPGFNGIYLAADIDLAGEKLDFGNFDNKTFLGNGHKISNFSIAYDATKIGLQENIDDGNIDAVYISLFGRTKNITVKDVAFEGVNVTISAEYSAINAIYVCPLAVSAKNCKFEGVSFTGEVSYDVLPEGFDESNLIVVTDRGAYVSEGSTDTGTYAFEYKGKK